MRAVRLLFLLLGRLARRRSLCYVAAFVLPAIVSWLIVQRQGIPYPTVHDEFSYLLGADTFAAGRLANPTPPSPDHFESMHILVEPTYSSKYPVAQALMLAAGQSLFGHPFWGVSLEISLLCLAALWALRGVLTARMALLAMIAAWLVFGVSFYWARSYWGGANAFAGAMLAIGATARLRHQPSFAAGALLAAGLSLLFFSRPVEGGLLALCLLVYLNRKLFHRQVLIPAALLGSATMGFQVQVNSAVTGNATRLPYAEHASQYLSAPFFWMLPPDLSPKRGTGAIQIQREKELREARREEGISLALLEGFLRIEFSMPRGFSLLSGLLLYGLLGRKRRRTWFVILLILAAFACLETWLFAHYLAPLLAVYWLILFGTFEQLQHLRWRKRRAGPAFILLLLGAFLIPSLQNNLALAFGPTMPVQPRQWVESELLARSGKHLVFVRRQPGFDITDEWVYNSAELSQSRILWVRDLGTEANARLLTQFPGRQAWLCEPEIRDQKAAGSNFPRLEEIGLKDSP